VIAVTLGGLGLLASLAAIVGLAANTRLQEAQTMSPQAPELKSMEEERLALTNRNWWPNAGFALLNAVLSVGMVAGGIMALMRAPRARVLLIPDYSPTCWTL
jgi:hypothetical protein